MAIAEKTRGQPAWSTRHIPGRPGCTEILSHNKKEPRQQQQQQQPRDTLPETIRTSFCMYKLYGEQRLWSFKTPPDFKKTTAPWELRRKELKSLQGTEGKGGRTPWCLIITPTHGLRQRRTRLEDLAYPPAIYRREHGGYHGQPL